MAASKDFADAPPAPRMEHDVDFAGYDPYIVALTAGEDRPVAGLAGQDPAETTESRKVKLMAWLRENRR